MLTEALEKINGAARKKLFVKLVNLQAQFMANTLNGVGSKEAEALNYSKMKKNLGESFADDVLKISFVLVHGE